MQPWRALPNAKLSSSHSRLHAHSDPQSQYAHQFHQLGLTDFHQACDYVWQLAYGRNRDNHDWRAVLTEKCGTCSSKHRLLKALADELFVEIAVEANEIAHFKPPFHYQYLLDHYGETEASAMWQC
jgi:hypothetical protein